MTDGKDEKHVADNFDDVTAEGGFATANSSPTDEELAFAAADGDRSAETELIRRYWSFAEKFSRSYYMAGAERDDLFQIAVIGLFEAVHSYNSEKGASFKTYASVCMRNSIFDAVRSSRSAKNSADLNAVSIDDAAAKDRDTLISNIPSPLPSPETLFIEKESEAGLYSALENLLGEPDFSIFRLYLAGLPYKDISAKIGVSSKKVDNVIYLAKKKIEKVIGEIKDSL